MPPVRSEEPREYLRGHRQQVVVLHRLQLQGDGSVHGRHSHSQRKTRTPGVCLSVGSVSTFAYGVLDAGHRYDLTDDKDYDLERRAIYHATFRDAASGGMIRVYNMTPNGFKVISEQDCKKNFIFIMLLC